MHESSEQPSYSGYDLFMEEPSKNPPFEGYDSIKPWLDEEQEMIFTYAEEEYVLQQIESRPVDKGATVVGEQTNLADEELMPIDEELRFIDEGPKLIADALTEALRKPRNPSKIIKLKVPTNAQRLRIKPKLDNWFCHVANCGKNCATLANLKLHQARSHKDALFCRHKGCEDRTVWPDETSIYEHTRLMHLDQTMFWCHLCHRHSTNGNTSIRKHVERSHPDSNAPQAVSRIRTEWNNRTRSEAEESLQ